MTARVHGIEVAAQGAARFFRFGFVRLLQHLSEASVDGSPQPDWVTRLHSTTFVHRLQHFRQCFRKFDRAVLNIALCTNSAERYAESRNEGSAKVSPSSEFRRSYSDPTADFRALQSATEDIPLHFDSMLFYLRIQADSYAKLVPFFYPSSTSGKMSDSSFRNQLKWFTTTKPDFDPEYSSILAANKRWFERLAGENPKGLRDIMVHHEAILNFRWNKTDTQTPVSLLGVIYTSKGPVELDLYSALREMTVGWCTFLDAVWYHFVKRLTLAGILRTMSADEVIKTRYLACMGGESDLPACWPYPNVDS